MESSALLATLRPLHRLALAYSPNRTRRPMLTLLAFDTRLAAIVRNSREPMLAQLRLAWWRELLGDGAVPDRTGDALIAAVNEWQEGREALAGLVDGWEAMVGPAPLPDAAFLTLADARANAFAAMGGIEQREVIKAAARFWALADLAAGLGDAAEQRAATALAQNCLPARPRLPRIMRTLAVLCAVASRRLRSGQIETGMQSGDLVAALRAGLLGR